MKQSQQIWGAETLDQFLAMPLSFKSETIMSYAGIYDKNDSDDLIAFWLS